MRSRPSRRLRGKPDYHAENTMREGAPRRLLVRARSRQGTEDGGQESRLVGGRPTARRRAPRQARLAI
jgi:hypothetical protein